MPPKGFLFSAVNCGLKKDRPDLGIIYSESPANWAGMFTTNAFRAAPVVLSQKKKGKPIRAIIVNSGIANAGTGEQGIKDAREMCGELARHLRIKEEEVLVASTGVIGERLPMEKIKKGIKEAVSQLSPEKFPQFANAIMTTDTFPKIVEKRVEEKGFSILGMAKGAGMIHPQMATMLVFLLTDANLKSYSLEECLRKAVDISFHCLTIDGDTSTNDSVFLLANGLGGEVEDISCFEETLGEVCLELARMIASDGEGATKLIIIKVKGGRNAEEARAVGRRIAVSPLVKTAFFGADPNVGRILCAIGNSQLKSPPLSLEISLGGVKVVEKGTVIDFPREQLREYIANNREIEVEVDLKQGEGCATVYTCDLSYDYVRINAEYTT
ncbi:MAG: bifunctional glutamate N-acetyltransferase/amino-acid acetyltransferase ArgJ [bacterium]